MYVGIFSSRYNVSTAHILSLAAAEAIFGFFKKRKNSLSFKYFYRMIVKWYHFALLVTLAIANPLPLGNPAEEQFLKKYFNSGFEFHSDEEKSFRTVSNYAKVRLNSYFHYH